MNQLRIFAIKSRKFVVAVNPENGETGVFIQTKEGLFHTLVEKGRLSEWLGLFKQLAGGVPSAVLHYFSFVETRFESDKVVLECKYFPFLDKLFVAKFSYDEADEIVHELWSARGFLDGMRAT